MPRIWHFHINELHYLLFDHCVHGYVEKDLMPLYFILWCVSFCAARHDIMGHLLQRLMALRDTDILNKTGEMLMEEAATTSLTLSEAIIHLSYGLMGLLQRIPTNLTIILMFKNAVGVTHDM